MLVSGKQQPPLTASAPQLAAHGLGAIVSVQARDVEQSGFPQRLAGEADALFLDLPGPWNVRRCPPPGMPWSHGGGFSNLL